MCLVIKAKTTGAMSGNFQVAVHRNCHFLQFIMNFAFVFLCFLEIDGRAASDTFLFLLA